MAERKPLVLSANGRVQQLPDGDAVGRRTGSLVIGDGTTTLFTAIHNFGHRRVAVQVVRNSGTNDVIDVDTKRATDNSIQVEFDPTLPPTSNQFVILYWEI